MDGEKRNGNPGVGESIFYIIFLLMGIPMITGLLGDFFRLRFLGAVEIEALGLTGSIETLITATSALFAIGAQSILAKDVGSGDEEESHKNYTSLVIVETIFTIVLAVLIVLFRYPLAELIGAEENGLRDCCATAIALFAIGMPADALFYLLSVILYLDDNTFHCILHAAIMNFVITGLALLGVTFYAPSFVAFLGVNIVGKLAVTLYMFWYKRRHGQYYKFEPKEFSMKRFLRILRVGLPGGLEYIHYAAYEYIIYLFVLRRFSSMYLMVFEIKEDIGGITETFVVGMCLLLVDRIGLAVGSGDKERLRKELKYSWLVCIGIAFVLGMLFIFLYPQLVDLFLGDIGPERAEVIHHSAYFLICTCIGLPFYVANNVFTSVYEVREMFVHAHMNYFLEVFAIVILYSIVLGMTIGIEGVWLAYPLAEATTFAVNMVLATVHNHRFPTRWLDIGFPAEKEVQNEKVLGDI